MKPRLALPFLLGCAGATLNCASPGQGMVMSTNAGRLSRLDLK